MASNVNRSQHYGELQKVVDSLFRNAETSEMQMSAARADSTEDARPANISEKLNISEHTADVLGIAALNASPDPIEPTVTRLQVVMAAEAADLPEDLMRIVNLLPPGSYTRLKLTTQLNSAIGGHAWGQVYGTVS